MTKHLFEFESSGFYAAEDRPGAIAAAAKNLGYAFEEATDDFLRDVPDDEVIDATAEESWGHASELAEERSYPMGNGERKKYTVYHLALASAEHAALAPDHGYCFGGEQ